MKNSEINEKKIIRFPLASAGIRLASRFLDMLLISTLGIGFGFLIICTDPQFAWSNDPMYISESWRYFLVSFIFATICILYFIILPKFWKGQTLFKKIFKIRFYSLLPLKNEFWLIFKHDLFIWVFLVFVILTLGTTLMFLGADKASELISYFGLIGTTSATEGVNDLGLYICSIIFDSLYAILGIIILGMIIAMFVKNKKPALQDKFSDLIVIKLSPTSTDTPNTSKNVKPAKKKINYGLPGEISSESFEEIDSL